MSGNMGFAVAWLVILAGNVVLICCSTSPIGLTTAGFGLCLALDRAWVCLLAWRDERTRRINY